jgi:aryl-alcohol dehydrogenase-like predicted oxidoreductase
MATAGRVTPHQPRRAYVHQMNMIVNSVLRGFLPTQPHGKFGQNEPADIALNDAPPTTAEIVLGTVQLGMRYGFNAADLDQRAAERMLDAAWDAGIRSVDTARAYGTAEERIGHWMRQRKRTFRIVTKASRPNRDGQHAQNSISQQFAASLKALGVERVDALLAHRVQDFLDSGTRAEFDRISREGKAAAIGASTYNPEDTVAAIEAGADIVQVPASVADWRHAALLQGANSARLMVRSLLLQGALLSQPAKLPVQLASLRPLIEVVGRWAAETQISPIGLLLRGARDGLGVRRFVLGFDTPEQIETAIVALDGPALPQDAITQLREIAARLPIAVIDPRLWQK